MNKQTEALKLAMEALELIANGEDYGKLTPIIAAAREALADHIPDATKMMEPPCKTGSQCTSKCEQCRYKHDCDKAEQPAQEPVAWMDGYRNIYSLEEKAAGCAEATIALVPMANQEKTSGSPINELQCVCGAVWLGEEMVHLPDKRPPASKPWVGLTDEEVDECYYWKGRQWTTDELVRHVEAKLRGKNA